MEIFISWSGERSRKIAEAMKVFLEGMIPDAQPWVSSKDVPAGSQWVAELSKGLDQSGFGILCLTKGNLGTPWVAFEAGALMKSFGIGRVCPFLMDVQISQLKLPFSLFQAVHSDKEGTWRLVNSIVEQIPDRPIIPAERLKNNYSAFWPRFKKALDQVRREIDPPSEMEQLQKQFALQESKIDAMHEVMKETLNQLRLNIYGKAPDSRVEPQ